MQGHVIAESGHVINLLPPVDVNGGAPVTIPGFSMKGWNHVSILLGLGVQAAPLTSILLKAAATPTGVGTSIPFSIYKQEGSGASQDVLGPRVAVTSAGFTTPSGNNKIFYVIELDAAELPDGLPYCQLVITAPASSILMSAFAILQFGRHQFAMNPTVLA